MTSTFIQQLPDVRACFAKYPVEKAWVFGSFSRGEERPDSDVDFLVQYQKDVKMSLMVVARLYRSLRDTLNREVDVVEEGYLLPYAEKTANKDKVLIYERTPER